MRSAILSALKFDQKSDSEKPDFVFMLNNESFENEVENHMNLTRNFRRRRKPATKEPETIRWQWIDRQVKNTTCYWRLG
ncbi:MAG TPA: hypothetical protein DEG92_01500 [Rikenellaceae bacterium]|nr:hypothetical protein [Rikenellaceae bacterium]